MRRISQDPKESVLFEYETLVVQKSPERLVVSREQ
jgi:hypothetical protein